MSHIVLARDEYEPLPEGAVKALVATVIKKLPDPARRKYAPAADQQRAADQYAALLDAAVDAGALRAFLDGHAAASARGRSWAVVDRLLDDVAALVKAYGAPDLNAALAKVTAMGEPQKCALPYLKAVLRNHAPRRAAEQPQYPLPRAGLTGAAVWQAAQARLRADLGDDDYRTWIEAIEFAAEADGLLVFRVPDTVYADALAQRYARMLKECWQMVCGRAVRDIRFDPDDLA